AERERLDDVIVGPETEADEAVYFVAASGEHYHRYLAFTADDLEDLPAIEFGQHHVEQHQVRLRCAEHRQRPLAGGCDLGIEPGVAEVTIQGAGDTRFVLYDQHLHDGTCGVAGSGCRRRTGSFWNT